MPKILVIEDEAAFRELIVQSLQLSGFETIEAENGRAGVELAISHLPDVIVSDVNMDGFDGYAALAAIRYQPRTAPIPFILMTGRPDQKGMRLAMDLGADDYLTKPFTIDALLTSVQTRLKKQAEARKRASETTQAATVPDEAVFTDATAPAPSLVADRPAELADQPALLEGAEDAVIIFAETDAVSAFASQGGGLDFTRSAQNANAAVNAYVHLLNAFHPNLGNGAVRAVAVCRTLNQLLQLSPTNAQTLLWAAALHDIALVEIERFTVRRWVRNPTQLPEWEMSLIRSHPKNSQRMLSHLPFFNEAGVIIRSHHENWNGTGYPDGLKEREIPWLARLLAVVIAYCHQIAVDPEALQQIELNAGNTFDPKAVEAVAQAAAATKLPRGIREILLTDLKPWHILGRDITDAQGTVRANKGSNLSESRIQWLLRINRVKPLDQSVWIYC